MTDTLMVGVSGVRGIVDKDLTPDIVARWARAFGRWAGERKPLVVVGRDSRPSGPRFARAVHEGLIAAGCDVIDVGLVPTPRFSWRSRSTTPAAASPSPRATIPANGMP